MANQNAAAKVKNLTQSRKTKGISGKMDVCMWELIAYFVV